MYTLMFAAITGLGIFLLYRGLEKQKHFFLWAGFLIIPGNFFLIWYLGFYAELLWFQSLGFEHRFWKVFTVKLGLTACMGFVSFGFVWLLTFRSFVQKRWSRWIPPVLAFLSGAGWGMINWEKCLKFFHSVQGSLTDPIYGKNAGFYLFDLPLFDALYQLGLILSGMALVFVCMSLFLKIDTGSGDIRMITDENADRSSKKSFRLLYINIAVFLLTIAWGIFLKRFHLMYSTLGAVTGPGWIDVHIRSRVYVVMGIVIALSWTIILIPSIRRRLRRLGEKVGLKGFPAPIPALAAMVALLSVLGIVNFAVLPGIFQKFRVEPNEITLEKPYIENSIQFTRHGFNLQDIEEKKFPASGNFNRQLVEDNKTLFSNVRLWDWRALDEVYEQFQEIRLYYEFLDVDIDRYTFDGEYRQVMVSARELDLDNLPEKTRTFVNKRFKYTHGFGITLTNVNEFTPQGLPNLEIKDIPPVSFSPDLEVGQPRIYYGEATDSYAVVNSNEKEFDYPSGEKNVYNRYDGSGGVQLENFWRKLVYGWKFGGVKLLLSNYPNEESRIMFHRNVLNRIRTLAPFLEFDNDPYIVLANKKLYWIIDAYTASDRFPYSEKFTPDVFRTRDPDQLSIQDSALTSLYGVNYIRNSVKCVVDAYEGSVDFYVFDREDLLIKVWQKIFPDMFKSESDMPGFLLEHIRYPADMLLAQGLVYAKFHMTDPAVFYNQEDLWIRATEKYYGRIVPVQPYYILWKPPGSKDVVFSLILPFTPKKRQVMIGWIAGLCDPDSYGRMIAYQFPKEKRVLGPQQVETKIDQDSYLSGQLSLWNQRGSNVIRGNVLAIPVEETIIYVEPIYLQAETAAYPELRLVAVMHDDNLSYETSFDKALEQLFEDRKDPLDLTGKPTSEDKTIKGLIDDASNAFDNYLEALGARKYSSASTALENLEKTIETLKKKPVRIDR
jgi:uncharacterized membrane protein (UPF0182 family)